jgi:hypothetical protein
VRPLVAAGRSAENFLNIIRSLVAQRESFQALFRWYRLKKPEHRGGIFWSWSFKN